MNVAVLECVADHVSLLYDPSSRKFARSAPFKASPKDTCTFMYNLGFFNEQCIYIDGNIKPFWAINECNQISIPLGVSSPQETQIGTFNHVVFEVV